MSRVKLKHKYPKLIFALLLFAFSFGGGVLSLQSAAADPQASCGKGTKTVQPGNGDPSYCVCKDDKQKVDTTNDNDCVDKCPKATTENKQNGQAYCNGDPNAGGDDSTSASGSADTACAGKNPPADCVDPALDCSTSTDGQCDFIGKYLNPAIDLLTIAFGLLATISIILGAINYSTSEGDPQKASKAKRRIANTIIAIVAYMFLFAFLQFIVPGGIFNR